MPNFALTRLEELASEFSRIKAFSTILEKIRKGKPHSYYQSLLGRLLVCKLAKVSQKNIEDFLTSSLDSFYYNKYKFFWSISHKENWLCAAISNKPIGIDVEINRKKSRELFDLFTNDEWRVLGKKSWDNFYKAWTAKEASLKAQSLNLDDFRKVIITGKSNQNLFLKYLDRTMVAQTFLKGEVIFSISQQSTDN